MEGNKRAKEGSSGVQVAVLEEEVATLTAQLEQARARAAASDRPAARGPGAGAGAGAGGWGNKKDEDNSGDVEAAIMTGGDASGFQPVSSVLRRVPGVAHPKLVEITDEMDRAVIRVIRVPAYRAGIVSYLAALHIFLLVRLL